MKRSDKKSSYTIIKRLAKLLRKDIFILALALLFAAVSIIASLYVNVAVGKAVDCMVSKDNVDFAGVGKQVSVILVCVLLAALFNYVMTVILSKVAYKTVKVLRNKVFAKLQKVPVSYVDRRTPGEMISRLINDIEHVSDGLILSFGQLFSGIVTIVTTLVFMFILDYKITFIVVLATPLTLLAAKFIADSTYRYFVIRSKDNGTLSSVAEEAISGISVLKAFDMEEMKRKELSELGAKLRSSQTKAVFFSSTVMPTTRIINGIIYASIGVFGALTVINGKGLPGGLTIGLLSSFLAYATKFSTPFNEISGVFAEFQGAVAGAGRVFEVLDAEEESERPGAVTSLKAKGSVKIDNVYFSYDPERPLIEGFDLDVREGMRVAVVGPTGCGKTTFINLLMRFYDVDSGSISIDGNDVRNVARDTVHSNYGMVLQETWLKQGTVRDNICIGRPDATMEEIVEAAKLARAHGFIEKLEKGYDTPVSDDLAGLSYGQKQLICIARLMLTSPPMLILDEATSSIDTRTEIKIQQGFLKLMRGRTSFIVAHRLSTIKKCDVIVVMKDGKIIEKGTHEELLSRDGFYRELYLSQNN